VNLVGILFNVILADARNHEPEIYRFRIDFNGEHSMEAATAAFVSKRVVFLPLRGL
jgi:hypothetical protein